MTSPYPLGSTIQSRVIIGRGAWEILDIPDWATLMSMTLYGAGGNGGNGFSGAAAASRGGGGSGATGAVSQLIMPIHALTPLPLYLFLGLSGSTSYLAIRPDISQVYVIMQAASGGNGGNSGSGSGGTAGTAASAATATDGPYQKFGMTQFRGGTGGQSGGTSNSNGNPFVWNGNGLIVCGGGAGGGVTGVDRAGGGITGAGPVPTIAASATGSVNGQDGYHNLSGVLPYSLGGQGGGASNAGVGGNGGNGGPGSGGGGGGGGTTGGTGGTGGPAFALISWS